MLQAFRMDLSTAPLRDLRRPRRLRRARRLPHRPLLLYVFGVRDAERHRYGDASPARWR
jgi:hypothetical protein